MCYHCTNVCMLPFLGRVFTCEDGIRTHDLPRMKGTLNRLSYLTLFSHTPRGRFDGFQHNFDVMRIPTVCSAIVKGFVLLFQPHARRRFWCQLRCSKGPHLRPNCRSDLQRNNKKAKCWRIQLPLFFPKHRACMLGSPKTPSIRYMYYTMPSGKVKPFSEIFLHLFGADDVDSICTVLDRTHPLPDTATVCFRLAFLRLLLSKTVDLH